MVNKYNVIWIMVDSVRRYVSHGDDRSRLAVMDEFAKEGVEFRNCVTSAPSTVMSVSASMTSIPAAHLGRNYADFQFDTSYFRTLPQILKENGWLVDRAFIMHREVREKLRQFDLVPTRLWPADLTHRKWWCNDDINRLIHHVLSEDADRSQPQFWFVDYNCRDDDSISDIVENTIRSVEAAGFDETNTIFVLCSDHGYPDPSRGITPEYLKSRHLTHDIFMTDDNIMIPLIIKYPGCKKGLKVEQTISTLDVMPTILDILNIECDEYLARQMKGKSLLPILREEVEDTCDDNRKIRCDARFVYQPGRISALRGSEFKYVFHHDSGAEEFLYVGENNNKDEPSVIDSHDPKVRNALEQYRKEFIESEELALVSQHLYSGYLYWERVWSVLASVSQRGDHICIAGTIDARARERMLELCDGRLNLSFLDVTNDLDICDDKFSYVFVTDRNLKRAVKERFFGAKIVVIDLNSMNPPEHGFMRIYFRAKEHFKSRWRNRRFYANEPKLLLYEPYDLYKKLRRQPDILDQKPWTPRSYTRES